MSMKHETLPEHRAVTANRRPDACARLLSVELSHHRCGQLVRVELALTGKLHNPNRDKFGDGHGFGSRQPQSGADLFEGFVHRVDLVRAKERRASASAVDCLAQLGSSLRGSPLVQ